MFVDRRSVYIASLLVCGILTNSLFLNCSHSNLKENQPFSTTSLGDGLPSHWQQISSGVFHSCGIESGKLYCWGLALYTQSIDKKNFKINQTTQTTPVRIGSAYDWQQVASFGSDNSNESHACGIAGGKLFCWGHQRLGQLGNGASGPNLAPILPVQIGTSNQWQQIAVGKDYSCGIEGGKLFCWGANSYGQIGNNDNQRRLVSTPTQVGSSAHWQFIATGDATACGIDAGKLFCWGSNVHGQIGNGTQGHPITVNNHTYNESPEVDALAPVQIGSSSKWSHVSMGLSATTCGIDNGNLFCWGNNSNAGIGNGTTLDRASPTLTGAFSDSWSVVSSGSTHTCGIESGRLFCWGKAFHNDTDANLKRNPILTPRQVGDANDWTTVSSGFNHTCALKKNGQLYCWGRNKEGQVATGSLAESNAPPNKVSIKF